MNNKSLKLLLIGFGLSMTISLVALGMSGFQSKGLGTFSDLSMNGIFGGNMFPTSLNHWESGDVIPSDWGNKLEEKIGADGSSDPTSLDYLLKNSASIDPGHKHTETSGGTGIYSYATGDMLYADNSNSLATLPIGSNDQVLKISGGVPAWGTDDTGTSGWAFATSTLDYWFDNTGGITRLDSYLTAEHDPDWNAASSSYYTKTEIDNAGYLTSDLWTESGSLIYRNGAVVIGATATTSDVQFEVNGKGKMSGGLVLGDSLNMSSNYITYPGNIMVSSGFGFIDAFGNDISTFNTVASAVNNISITNAATGANPKISTEGSDTNIGLTIQTKGNGIVYIPSALTIGAYTLPATDGSNAQVLKTNGSGTLSWQDDLVGYQNLSDLQTAVSNDFHNLGGTDADSWAAVSTDYYTKTDIDSAGYYSSLSDLQTSVSSDFHNLGGTDANTTYTAGDHLTLSGTTINADPELNDCDFSMVMESPTDTDDALLQKEDSHAYTISKVTCSTDTGTADIQFDERTESTPNTAGTDVMSSALQCDNNSANTTTFSNAGIAADSVFNLDIDATASTPGILRIHVYCSYDD